MAERVPIDWGDAFRASTGRRMMEFLQNLPRHRWADREANDATLLHVACQGPEAAPVVALLQSDMLDVNARNRWGATPAHFAVWSRRPRPLEVLIAKGVDFQTDHPSHSALINHALMPAASTDSLETISVLLANGARLSAAGKGYRKHITPAMVSFECGVLRCRTAVAAMLRVKRAGQLWRWDKFLLKEIALAVWTTRYGGEWQN